MHRYRYKYIYARTFTCWSRGIYYVLLFLGYYMKFANRKYDKESTFLLKAGITTWEEILSPVSRSA